MKTKEDYTITEIRKKFKSIQSLIENGAVIISKSKKILVSEKARKKMLEKNINPDEFINWAKKENNLSRCLHYSGLSVCKISIPNETNEKESLVIFCEQPCKEQTKSPILTLMEKNVIENLAKGLSNKQIASNLKISAGTVNAHLDNIYRKLGVSNRVQAVCAAVKWGIIDIE